ncbi:prepilin peptidase [Croceicoccus naphthovorans]|uniref:Uncharacterized protein n=1 Tax=Croceicoccus naphthovorans TaxID=1348774 RepID=A0A0G3XFF2_9SPHN|nr:A24 family peptidase [Croceicoccus naphthovorans]AKM09937.1 hypothetical protein AB433_08035 [Croceicoccus naphthovorans]MBB3990908.1 leader peptidase (prepilin peptidase)/N-methyltransferase [Croceicoccus naphthovorans]
MDGSLVLAGAGLGLLIGSFIGAAATRLPRGENVVTGRSHCDACGRTLAIRDLVPVASYLMNRGQCRSCGGAIDPAHLLAELGGAAIGGLATVSGGTISEIAIAALFGWQLLLLALIDLRHYWLPPKLIALLAVTSPLLLLLTPPSGPYLLERLAGGALSFAMLAAPALAYRAIRKREGMGAADPWLLGAIGLWIGPMGVVSTVVIAAGSGLAAAVVLKLAGRDVGGGSALPLGSLMAASAFAVSCVTAFA